MEVKMETIKRLEYYRTTSLIQLPINSGWRIWKFRLEDDTWKMFKGIKSLKQLRDYLVVYNPVAFYYSLSEFLPQQMPDKIEHPNYQIADQLWLDNKYFVVDIDNKTGSPQVRSSAYQVIERMKQFPEYVYERCIMTGTGLRLEFRDTTPRPILLPYEREEFVKRKRKEFCQINLDNIEEVDDVIAWDTRRVIKCIGSPNPHNEFTTNVLTSPAYLPAIPGKLSQVNEMDGDTVSSLHEQGNRPDRELGSSPTFLYPMYFGKFIRNKVEGTKDRFVPYFEYHKKYKTWQEDIRFLQRKYGLSTIYIVDDYLKVLCVGVDAIPADRLDKIYNQSKSIIKHTWQKFRNLYIRTSSYFDFDLKRIEEEDLKPLFCIDNTANKLYPVSKPHLDLLNHLGFDTSCIITKERDVIGNNRNQVFEAFFSRRQENGGR
jgi:hypothetical protein